MIDWFDVSCARTRTITVVTQERQTETGEIPTTRTEKVDYTEKRRMLCINLFCSYVYFNFIRKNRYKDNP